MLHLSLPHVHPDPGKALNNGGVGDYFSCGGCNEDYWVLLLGLQRYYTVAVE